MSVSTDRSGRECHQQHAVPGDTDQAFDILAEDRNKMFAEAIDVIVAIWERDPPYGIGFPNNRFKVTTRKFLDWKIGAGIMATPFKKPRPEIDETVQPDDQLTPDFVLDGLVIFGTVNSVVDQILAMCEKIGAFGELVYAGMDWVDETLAKRSMVLMAEEVMPRVNAALR